MQQSITFICNDPKYIPIALTPFRDVMQHPDGIAYGWGLAYYQSGEAMLRRQPRGHDSAFDFFDISKDLKGVPFLIQTKELNESPSLNENTPPFRFRRWAFSMLGLESGSPLNEEEKKKLRQMMPPFIQRNIRGSTHAEWYFHIFLSFLYDANILDAPKTDVESYASCLRNSLHFIKQLKTHQSFNLMISNGRMIAAMSQSMPLYLKRKESYEQIENQEGKIVDYPQLKSAMLTTTEAKDFTPIAEETIVIVDRNIDVFSFPIT